MPTQNPRKHRPFKRMSIDPVHELEPTTDAPQHHYLLDWSESQLCDWLTERGWPKFRSRQILTWVYQKRADSFAAMPNVEIEHFLIYPRSLPTDIRHNAKIFREKLKPWAEQQLLSKTSP